MKILVFSITLLKTSKSMIEVYDVGGRYMVLLPTYLTFFKNSEIS